MTSPKANPPKPTAAQSISGNEATENDYQKYGEGGSRLRPKRDAITQHGKDFPNRAGNTTTRRMSLRWSSPIHEGKCPGRFQITDDFRQAQKKAGHP